jgi:hypothetical protein
MMKIEGFGSGSISQSHGSADPDPDPHQNVMDPQHCQILFTVIFFSRINPNKKLGFLNTWFSSLILLGFLLLPNPIHSRF